MTWHDLTIGDLGRVVTGKTPETKNRAFYDGAYPFVTPSDIGFNHYVCEATETTVTDLARDRLRNQFIPAGSVIVTCIGNTIGKAAIAATECLTNQQMNSIVVDQEHDEKFVYYLMCHNVERIRGVGLGGGAAQPIINKSTFCGLKVRVPEKAIQTAIARVLSAYDDLMGNNTRRIERLERSARLLFEEWFVRLRYPGHEHDRIVDGVPQGWTRNSVGELTTFVSRGITPKYDDSAPGLVINQKCIRNGSLSLQPARHQSKEVPREKLVRTGDVLVNSTGEGTLGRVAQLYDELENCTVNSHVTIVRPGDDVDSYFFGLSVGKLEAYFASQGRGATNQKELSRATIEDVQLLVAPTPVQHAFSNFVGPVKSQVLVLSKQIRAAAAARDLLLPRLMDGKIEV